MSRESFQQVRRRAILGVAWSAGTGLAVRGVQAVSTVVVTYFLSKEQLGEVINAALLALNLDAMSNLGVPHYLVARPTDRRTAWQATVMLVVTGAVAMLAALALIGPASAALKLPRLGDFLPLLAVATMIGRVASIPERLLQHKLMFREASLSRSTGELGYVVCAIGGAAAGWGGMAIVAANLCREVLRLGMLSRYLSPREWATPHPIDWAVCKRILAFGVPLGGSVWLSYAARTVDNFAVSALFGAAVVGVYNIAYNMADIPASQVGEHVGEVVVPSFAQLDAEQRRQALPRALGLLCFVVFPLGVGLGATAPTVVEALLPQEWAAVGPPLAILAVLSVARPVGWTMGAYLQVLGHTRAIMVLSAARLAALLALVFVGGAVSGPLGACAGVGVAFLGHALANVVWVGRVDRALSVPTLLGGPARALVACAVMVGFVILTRRSLPALGIEAPALRLVSEVALGAVGYLVAALLVARTPMRDLLRSLQHLAVPRPQAAE